MGNTPGSHLATPCDVAEELGPTFGVVGMVLVVVWCLSLFKNCSGCRDRLSLVLFEMAALVLVCAEALQWPFRPASWITALSAVVLAALGFDHIAVWACGRVQPPTWEPADAVSARQKDRKGRWRFSVEVFLHPLVVAYLIWVLAVGLTAFYNMLGMTEKCGGGTSPTVVWLGLFGATLVSNFWLQCSVRNPWRMRSYTGSYSFLLVLYWLGTMVLLCRPSDLWVFGDPSTEVGHDAPLETGEDAAARCFKDLQVFLQTAGNITVGNCTDARTPLTSDQAVAKSEACRSSMPRFTNIDHGQWCEHLRACSFHCHSLFWDILVHAANGAPGTTSLGIWQLAAAHHDRTVEHEISSVCAAHSCATTAAARAELQGVRGAADIVVGRSQFLCEVCASAGKAATEVARAQYYHRLWSEALVIIIFVIVGSLCLSATGMYVWKHLVKFCLWTTCHVPERLEVGMHVKRSQGVLVFPRRHHPMRDVEVVGEPTEDHKIRISDDASTRLSTHRVCCWYCDEWIRWIYYLPWEDAAIFAYWLGTLWAVDTQCKLVEGLQPGSKTLLLRPTVGAHLSDAVWGLTVYTISMPIIPVGFQVLNNCSLLYAPMQLWRIFRGRAGEVPDGFWRLFALILGGVLLYVHFFADGVAASALRTFFGIESAWLPNTAFVAVSALVAQAILAPWCTAGRDAESSPTAVWDTTCLAQAGLVVWHTAGCGPIAVALIFAFVALVLLLTNLAVHIRACASYQQQFLKRLGSGAADHQGAGGFPPPPPTPPLLPREKDLREVGLHAILVMPRGWWLWPVLGGPRRRVYSSRTFIMQGLAVFEQWLQKEEIVDHVDGAEIVEAILTGHILYEMPNIAGSAKKRRVEKAMVEGAFAIEDLAQTAGCCTEAVRSLAARARMAQDLQVLAEAQHLFLGLAGEGTTEDDDLMNAVAQWERLQTCGLLCSTRRGPELVERWQEQLRVVLRSAANRAVRMEDRTEGKAALAKFISAKEATRQDLGLDDTELQTLKESAVTDELREALQSRFAAVWSANPGRMRRLRMVLGYPPYHPQIQQGRSSNKYSQLLGPRMRHTALWCMQLQAEEKENQSSDPDASMTWFSDCVSKVLVQAISSAVLHNGDCTARLVEPEPGLAAVALALLLGINVDTTKLLDDAGEQADDPVPRPSLSPPAASPQRYATSSFEDLKAAGASATLSSSASSSSSSSSSSSLPAHRYEPGSFESLESLNLFGGMTLGKALLDGRSPTAAFEAFQEERPLKRGEELLSKAAASFYIRLVEQLAIACCQQDWAAAQRMVMACDDLSALLLERSRSLRRGWLFAQQMLSKFTDWFAGRVVHDLQHAFRFGAAKALWVWEDLISLCLAAHPLGLTSPMILPAFVDAAASAASCGGSASASSTSMLSSLAMPYRSVQRHRPKTSKVAPVDREEATPELGDAARCFLDQMGALSEACGLKEILASRLRVCIRHQWEDGLLQGLQQARQAATADAGAAPPGSPVSESLLREAQAVWCRLHGLPRSVDPATVFMLSKGLMGLSRISSLERDVLEAEVSPHMLSLFQQLLNETRQSVRTRDRRDGAVPEKYEVHRVTKVFNFSVYQGYLRRKAGIVEELEKQEAAATDYGLMTNEPSQRLIEALELPPLQAEAGEAMLFHGTKPSGVRSIMMDDFNLRFARDGLFGRGVYFAESCSKSDEYTQPDKDGLRPLLLCRVALGKVYYCDVRDPDRRGLERACTGSGGYHSVLGDRKKVHNTFREFICYDVLQAYVHFVIWYRRL